MIGIGDDGLSAAARSARRWRWTAVAAGCALLSVVAVWVIRGAHGHPRPPAPAPPQASPTAGRSRGGPVAVPLVTEAQLGRLAEATTDTTLPDAPLDTGPAGATDGVVVHNPEPVPVFDAPGGIPFARLPPHQAGSPTWLPVIGQQPGWVRVLLPARPNGATGWLDISRVEPAHSVYEIRVELRVARLTLWRDHHAIAAWSIAVGAPTTPTPAGRTFLLASVVDPTQTFSPVILPLGIHSTTLVRYAGGPATTAIHTWADPSVYGHALSNGCLRVPPAALRLLTQVPLGTVVRLDP
jgi:hypothetical protein